MDRVAREDPELASPRLVRAARRSPARSGAEKDTRTRRTAVNLALLRAPLEGLELDSFDHAALTWLADRDGEVVATVFSLLGRARAAAPPGSTEDSRAAGRVPGPG
ncbi:hypothetical protein ABT337_05410 [Saccharopolyspora hirsuta]|uniref:Uncharacterized protein n=1 Tax=Saccharopolyspora hirsuta TaxID=1837 RepID=A0A5M7C9R8_SACHI|nr:hypothetical protein [Saccharopolyspora hirsuta]KAA5838130.1 hypothetical protein F1721_01355 [Saccharopolyspora hirsuta]